MNIYTNIRVFILQAIMLCFIAVNSGCAIQQNKPADATVKETIIVDSDVQKIFYQALELLQEGQFDTAINLLNTVVERENRMTAPYINLAMAHRRKGDDKLAEENLLKALAIDQGQPVANNELGIIYRKQGRFIDAKKVYTNALTAYPDYLPVIRNLGILCDLYMRDAKCALEQFEKYQEHVPEDQAIKIWIADLKARS